MVMIKFGSIQRMLTLLLLVNASSIFAANTIEQNLQIISADHPKSFYCNCEFGEGSSIKDRSCFKGNNSGLDAEHVNWLSLIAFSNSDFPGLSQAKLSQLNQDIQLIQPLVSEQLVLPEGYRFGSVGKSVVQSLCGIKLDTQLRTLEPPNNKKGNIARILFYLHEYYGYKLEQNEIDLLQAWQESDPPDNQETSRNSWVSILQKTSLNIPRHSLRKELMDLEARSSRDIVKMVKDDYKNLQQTIEKTQPEIQGFSGDAERYFELGLDIWIQQIREGKKSAWTELLEAYNLASMSQREAKVYIDRSVISSYSKRMSLAILMKRDDEAAWYAMHLLNHLHANGWSDYQYSYTGLMYAIARIIDEQSWPTPETIKKMEFPYKALFELHTSEYQLSSRFQRASDYMLNGHQFGTPLPSEKLFQVELLAYLKLLKEYKNREVEHKPGLFDEAFMALPDFSDYQPTKLETELEKAIKQLQPIPELHQAVLAKDLSKIKKLLQTGDTLNQFDRMKRTPLSIATDLKDVELINILIANSSEVFGDSKWGLIHSSNLVRAMDSDRDDIALLLLEKGANPNNNSINENPLKRFFRMEHVEKRQELLIALLRMGADPRQSETHTLDSLFGQEYSGKDVIALFEIFKKYGADPKLSNALCFDNIQVQPELMKYLLKQGMDPNKEWYLNTRPIHCAVERSRYLSTEILLKAGADPKQKTFRGLDAFQIAVEREDSKMLELLKRYSYR